VPGTTAAAEAAPEPTESTDRSGIDGIERVALSFGLSIAIVPLIGLVLNFTPFGIRLVPIVVSISAFTLVNVAVAARRRRDLPAEDRFRVPYEAWIADARGELFEPDSRTDAALNVLLAVSVILAVGSVGYAVAVPQQGESFSEFYLLTEDSDGELVADGYPTDITIDDRPELIVGIGNQEYEPTNYTVVVQLQEIRTEGNSTIIEDRTEIDRFTTSVAHNETYQERRTIVPTRTAEDLRVKYLLYTDEVPQAPTAETAYRDLHLYMNVTDG
jgi:Predicted membrane protein